MLIREYDDDWLEVWPIVEEVVRAGDTFCYDPQMTEQQARDLWVQPAPARVVVAVEGGLVVGTSSMYANRPGPGAHIASGSFMVSSAGRGRGCGRALVLDLLAWARAHDFAGVQFNAVAASNVAAVGLYESLGFAILGTVPGGFQHPRQGRVGLHVMFHDLTEPAQG